MIVNVLFIAVPVTLAPMALLGMGAKESIPTFDVVICSNR